MLSSERGTAREGRVTIQLKQGNTLNLAVPDSEQPECVHMKRKLSYY